MRKSPEKLNEVLARIIKVKGWEKKLAKTSILTSWEKLFPAPLSTEAKPLKIESGKLFLQVKNGVWKNELSYQKPQILQKLNQFSGSQTVTDIIFVS